MKISMGIKLGILLGIINCIVWYTVAVNLGYYEIKVYYIRNFATYGILIFGIFISIYFKRKNNNGFLEFKDALKEGVLYSLIIAVILGIFNYIYYKYITPDTIYYFISEIKKDLIANHIEGAKLQAILDDERSHYGSFKLIPSFLFFGLLISLLAGAIFQRKDPNAVRAN